MNEIAAKLGEVGLPMPTAEMAARRWDAVVVGGGHNGLTAAAYLARAGRSVLVLERRERLGGVEHAGLVAEAERKGADLGLVPEAGGAELEHDGAAELAPRGHGVVRVAGDAAGRDGQPGARAASSRPRERRLLRA